MASDVEAEEDIQAKMYRRNTKRLRRNLLQTFLIAMKEDLAEWLASLTNEDLNAVNFMKKLDNGVLLCEHANLVQKHAEEYALKPDRDVYTKIPKKSVYYRVKGAFRGSFIARDNVANFISWCRDIGVPDVVMFETEDLVLHKNEKTVVLTLLDVARKAAKFGVKPPQLVELEEEIDREIEQDKKELLTNKNKVEKVLELEEENDLDQLVQDVVEKCTCPSKFPVRKLGDGKYKFGKCKTLIFVRVMRNHVMVRVGGGWDTLEHYINKHDPCRVHVAGKVDKNGKGEKFPTRKLSTTIEFNSDEASVCSSESFGSADGYLQSSISPDSEDVLSPQMSESACSSHRSSIHQDSDEDFVPLQSSRSEPVRYKNAGKSTENLYEDESTVRLSKSDTFTKFGQKKLSLMNNDIKESDVYATRNPADSWLRRQLNEIKQAAQAKSTQNKTEDQTHVDEKENLTIENIKKKYGKDTKSPKMQRKDTKSTNEPRLRRRSKTPLEHADSTDLKEEMPNGNFKSDPQCSSWDQTDVAAKRRKDVSFGNESRRDSSSGIPRLVMTPQNSMNRRPEFHKSYTLDVSSLKSKGIRRRGSECNLDLDMRRETSSDCIERRQGSRLPVPTFRKAGRLARSAIALNSLSGGGKNANLAAKTRVPISRAASRKSCTPLKKA